LRNTPVGIKQRVAYDTILSLSANFIRPTVYGAAGEDNRENSSSVVLQMPYYR
jgi:hypothetical protein